MTSDLYNIALDCIDKHAESPQTRDKTALIFVKEDKEKGGLHHPLFFTFSELKDLSNRLANSLSQLNLNIGDRLILRLPNCPEFPIAFIGAIKAGLIPIPTSAHLTWNELEFMLKDSAASVLVTTEELLPADIEKEKPKSLKKIIIISQRSPSPPPSPLEGEGVRRTGEGAIYHWQELLRLSSSSFKTRLTHTQDPAYWLYTSGTEGVPKAVIHCQGSIRAHDPRTQYWQNLKKEDVVFNTSSLNWSYALTAGLLDLWRHEVTSVVYAGDLRPELLEKVMEDSRVSILMSVPSIYRRWVEYFESNPSPPSLELKGRIKEGFTNTRVCLSAGEKLGEEIRRRFQKQTGLEIYEGLGMTEHSVYLVQRYGEALVKGSCGKPFPGQKIAILKEDLTEVKAGEMGILASHRSCEGLMLGYHARPEEEAKMFQGDWFLSGDLAYQDQEGNFFFEGRQDDVIKAGGYRISPLEVESVLNRCPAVIESAVVSREIETAKTIVVAYIVPQWLQSPIEKVKEEILESLKTQLAKYKIPREFVFVKELPKTSNGKIKRKALSQCLSSFESSGLSGFSIPEDR